jgi:hypothetical protein
MGCRLRGGSRLFDDHAAVAERGHALRTGVPIASALMWELEHGVLEFLTDITLNPVECLRCALQFTRLATTGDPALPTTATLREAMARGIPLQVRQTVLATTKRPS